MGIQQRLTATTSAFWRAIIILCIASTISACASFSHDGPPLHPIDPSTIADATPKYEPISSQGNPPSYVINGKTYTVKQSAAGYVAEGVASWYGTKFHGNTTANGETYDMYAMTAAHTELPIPTYVQVTNLENKRSVIVRINDRGPFHDNRLIDLSYAAATKLGMTQKGTALVKIRAIDTGVSGNQEAKMLSNVSLGQRTHQGQHYLQMGAFHQRQNAQQLLNRVVKQLESPVKITEHASDEGPLYRVRVGPFNNRDEVEIIRAHLVKIGFKSHFVVFEPL